MGLFCEVIYEASELVDRLIDVCGSFSQYKCRGVRGKRDSAFDVHERGCCGQPGTHLQHRLHPQKGVARVEANRQTDQGQRFQIPLSHRWEGGKDPAARRK